MNKVKVFCFGFGQVAKNFINKILKEKQDLELNISSRKKLIHFHLRVLI